MKTNTMFYCSDCGNSYLPQFKDIHLRSKKHQQSVNGVSNCFNSKYQYLKCGCHVKKNKKSYTLIQPCQEHKEESERISKRWRQNDVDKTRI